MQNLDWSNKVIMVVDDTPTNFFLIKTALRNTKAEFIWAQNGLEALEEFNKDQQIDVIMMDIRMPVMDGYETTRKIRETDKDIPIIAQTSYAMQGDKDASIEAGCNDYISKPVSLQELKDLLAKYLNE